MQGQTVRRILTGADMGMLIPPTYNCPIVCLPGMGVAGGADLQLRMEDMIRGIGIVGATGSGKTYATKRIVEEIRNNIENPYTMVIIQAKDDFNDLYREGDLVLAQGGNQKSVKWNLFQDLLADGYDMRTIELNTRQFVKHLFSYKKDSKEQFFVEGASELLYCIIISYITLGINSLQERRKLTNKGLLEFFLNYNEENYIQVLENCEEPGVLNCLLGDSKDDSRQALGVWGELVATVLQTFVDIFAEDGDFSICEFIRDKQNKVLFINYDPRYKDTQVRIFESVINLMLNEALSQNATDGNVILICDEISAIGKTDIATAVNIGRAKGLVAICGYQSIEQLYSIYGEHDGRNLLAGLCTKIYFKPNDPTTKQYMQEEFGKTLAEYMVLSPGGCCTERKESYVIEDEDIYQMNVGDCYVKDSEGSMYRFKVD